MLSIAEVGNPTTSILLTKAQSFQLRGLIIRAIDCKFSTYIQKVGLVDKNVYAVFNGRRRLTLNTLERLLSGTDLVVQCQIEFLVQTNGGLVNGANYPNLEEELFLETGEESDQDQSIGEVRQYIGIGHPHQSKKEP